MRVLIVGDSIGALAATRELGKAGWTVGIGSGSRLGLSSVSRWATHWHHVPPPIPDATNFVRGIDNACQQIGYDVVFGAGDAEVLALSAYRGDIRPLFPYSEHSSVVRGFDKLELVDLAQKSGLSAPLTREANDRSVVEFRLPIVVKSRLHWSSERENRDNLIRASVARTREDALARARSIRLRGGDPIFQQYVPGTHLLVTVVVGDGSRLLSAVSLLARHLSIRECAETVQGDAVTVEVSFLENICAFLRELKWRGLAMFQFQKPDLGDPELVDFNGRMNGGLGFANACGMRAHDTWARLAMGQSVEEQPTRTGLRYQELVQDLVRASCASGIGRFGEILRCMLFAPTAVHPIISLADPLPGLVGPLWLASRRISRMLVSRHRPVVR